MRTCLIAGAMLGSSVALPARGDDFTFLRHEASGSGWASVFDDGPIDSESDATTSDDDPWMLYGAIDIVGSGTSAAIFGASGWSMVSPVDDTLFVRVKLTVSYLPSLSPGGHTPGGEGAGELSSVIEFIRPAGEIDWLYGLDFDLSFDFEGQTNIVVENVTQSRTLVTFSDADNPAPFGVKTTLDGNAGDLIHITSAMSGGGSVPADLVALGEYDADLIMEFTHVPEPGTLALLSLATAGCLRRKRPQKTNCVPVSMSRKPCRRKDFCTPTKSLCLNWPWHPPDRQIETLPPVPTHATIAWATVDVI